jgi:hypothetical protein
MSDKQHALYTLRHLTALAMCDAIDDRRKTEAYLRAHVRPSMRKIFLDGMFPEAMPA